MKITLVLHNIRSTYNVGAILRTAEGLGIERVVYSGYTPRFNDAELLPHLREKLNHQIVKAALGAEKLVPQVYLEKESSLADSLTNTDILEEKSSENTLLTAQKDQNLPKNSENQCLCLTKWLKCATMEGYTVMGLENNLSEIEMSRQLILGQQKLPNGEKIKLGDRLVLVLGEEVSGIPAEIRPLMDYFLEIPMHGQKESFNVSVATGIALWGLQNCY